MEYADHEAEFYEQQHRRRQIVSLKQKAAALGLEIMEPAAA
jgi:hypothetical protein